MKKFIGILLLLPLVTPSFALTAKDAGRTASRISDNSEKGIHFFDGSWAEALKLAEKEKKIIFLDAYAAWCGPCKWMAANAFKDEAVGTFFNEHFINYKMDMEKNESGPRLSAKYSLNAYPSLYFVDHNEAIVYQQIGALKGDELLALGKEAFGKVK